MTCILRDYQLKAVHQMNNGCILNGGVGSGKSRTSLAYFCIRNGGKIINNGITLMKKPKNLFIITTAKKRNDNEWEDELNTFNLSIHSKKNKYKNQIIIDSWNNIKKYKDIKNSFFIFDEDKVTGKGVWAKTFIKIAKNNEWIILSATPGDTWEDYIPVFVANGFYRNFSDFRQQHIVYSRFCSYPKIDKFINTGKLNYYRRKILVEMNFKRNTVRIDKYLKVTYDRNRYKITFKERWNFDTNEPVKNAAELCYILRKIVNSDTIRSSMVKVLSETYDRLIIFYNFDYELEILKNINYGKGFTIKEYNGHKHEKVPDGKKWIYLVQYTSGAEAWNCITTNVIVFYSLNYSYKIMEQSRGRIDRMNTPYKELYYYYLKSDSPIDLAIDKALQKKKKFNEKKFIEG